METKILENKITRKELNVLAKKQFGDFVKAVVDIEKSIMAIGAELHADMESIMLEQGSEQNHLWGINLYPNQSDEHFVEFNSMINVRPAQGNRSRGVENPEIQEKIKEVVRTWIT